MLMLACGGGEDRSGASVGAASSVDSIFSPEESLRRFRAGLDTAAGLRGGEASPEALAQRWIRAVESHDTLAIRRLVLDRAEFAWLYYPSSRFSAGPFHQPPDLLWFLFQQNGEKGIVRVLRRLGGTDLDYVGLTCPREPRIEGENRIREYCAVRRVVGGDTLSQVLFGGIIERGGRFKFISYTNQF